MFFNNVKTLLKKLELIIGEIMAGNTSVDMHNSFNTGYSFENFNYQQSSTCSVV